jgi:ABC-2 type transport system ATP-binding protein
MSATAASTEPVVIEAKDLRKVYGAAAAVDGIDLTIRRGEIFGLLGPNGAGKTTTILMMIGLTDVSSGTVRVLGLDPTRDTLEVKRRVGYMPDSVGFYDNLTARENLLYTARLAGIDRAAANNGIAAALERVRLIHVIDRKVETFSRGMRQRLGLAEILLKKAEVAILDEPTSGLDPQATHELLDMIRDLKSQGVAVILSSHLLEQVQSICDRVALFHGGKIALLGTVPDLARLVLGGGFTALVEAPGVDLQTALADIPGMRRVAPHGAGISLVFADSDIREHIARKVVAARGKLLQMNKVEPSLDDIYRHYFKNPPRAA